MGKKAKKDRERIKGKVGGENKKGRNRKEGIERKSKKGKGRERKEKITYVLHAVGYNKNVYGYDGTVRKNRNWRRYT